MLINPGDSGMSKDLALQSVPAMNGFLEGLNIPLKMRDLGVPQQDIPVCRQHNWETGHKNLRWCFGSGGSCYAVLLS